MGPDSDHPLREGSSRQKSPTGLTGKEGESSSISAMVLAAGLGTRLLPLTCLRAKPAVPFLGRPLIHYSLDLITQLNPEAVVVNLHHLPDTVITAVKQYRGHPIDPGKPLEIAFSEEAEILGTAGGVRYAAGLLEADHIVVINGKIYSDLELSSVLSFHCRKEALVTLVVVPFEAGSPFNPVRVGVDGRVLGFGPQGPGKPYTFTGIQMMKHQVLGEIPSGKSDLVKDVYPTLIEKQHRVLAYVCSHLWYECSTPWRYLQGSLLLRSKRATELTLQEEQPAECGLIAGTGCSIETGSQVRDTILWEGVEIGKNCRVSNAIICSGVRIPDHSLLREVIATPRIDPGSISPVTQPLEKKGYLVWPLRPE